MKNTLFTIVILIFIFHYSKAQNSIKKELKTFNKKIIESFDKKSYQIIQQLLPKSEEIKQYMELDEEVTEDLSKQIENDTQKKIKKDYDITLDISELEKIKWSEYNIKNIEILQDKI